MAEAEVFDFEIWFQVSSVHEFNANGCVALSQPDLTIAICSEGFGSPESADEAFPKVLHEQIKTSCGHVGLRVVLCDMGRMPVRLRRATG